MTRRIKSLDECNQQLQINHKKTIAKLEKSLSALQPKETRTTGIQAVKERTLSTGNNANDGKKGAMERIRSHYQQKIKEMKKYHEQELKNMKSRIPQSGLKTNRSPNPSINSSLSHNKCTDISTENKGVQADDDISNEGYAEKEQNSSFNVSSSIAESTIASLNSQLEYAKEKLKSFLHESLQDEDISENDQQLLSTLVSKLRSKIENKDAAISQLQQKVRLSMLSMK